ATPTSGQAPLTVQFTDASDGGGAPITSRLWRFGDGGTSTQLNPSHTYDTAGTYDVMLTVASGAGNDTETKVGFITVQPPPQDEVRWRTQGDGDWNDPNDWTGLQLPKPDQLAVIDIPGMDITVTIS